MDHQRDSDTDQVERAAEESSDDTRPMTAEELQGAEHGSGPQPPDEEPS